MRSNQQIVWTSNYKKRVWKLIDYLLKLFITNYSVNFHIDLKALQKDSTDGLFADVVTLGARAIHNAT